MKILLTAPTRKEIHDLHTPENTEVLITGVGTADTVYFLTKKLQQNHYDFIINAGVAGAIDKSLKIGEVVEVTEDEFFAFGSEDNHRFLSVFDLNLTERNRPPFTNGKLQNPSVYTRLPKVKGTTVQTVHGSPESISKIAGITDAQIETMEGAAFMYVCLMEKVNFIQLRAISNYVEPRNFDNWKLDLAIKNLHKELTEIIHKL
ncbi:MAG: futalosine hydrolase [Bacteroidetes bacterium]|nr:MAG: futalosine hydrolase [Bacteroidota bacterium]